MLLYVCLLIGSLFASSNPQEERLSKKPRLSIPPQSSSIELPCEIKNQIYSYLDKEHKKNLALVCSDFHSISQKNTQEICVSLKKNITSSEAQQLLSKLPNLKKIEFFVDEKGYRLAPINSCLNTILSHALQIKSIDLSNYSWVTDDALANLNLLKNLKSLNLDCCDKITDKGLKALPSSLISLDLHACKKITDASIKTLPSNLTNLSLYGCTKITDEGLKALPSSLTSLNLHACKKITDEGLKALPSSLISLDLHACKKITDKGLKALPSSLTSLDLSDCTNIKDAGLETLPSNLMSLNLGCCTKITNKGLANLPINLTWLNLSGCWNIQNVGYRHLIRLENLLVLILKDFNISNEMIQELKSKSPQLNVHREK